MARFVAKAAIAVALLAIFMQYSGFVSKITSGLGMVFPRLSGAPPRTINAPKLLADLNSDVIDATASSIGTDRPRGGEDPTSRAVSAALSVMYLASMPGLKEQVKQSPGVLESLVRRLMTLDLAEAQQELLKQGQAQQQGQQGQMDLMSAAVLAVAKMAAGDRPMQDWLLGAAGGSSIPGGRSAQEQLPRGELLGRLGKLLSSGIPAWQAAASYLLHALSNVAPDQSSQPQPHPLVASWVAERADSLVNVGRSLVEAGAHFNSSDAVLSGSRLLQLVALQPIGKRLVLEEQVPALLAQVVLSYSGDNSSGPVVGGATRLLSHLLAASGEPNGAKAQAADEGKDDAARSTLIHNLTSAGLVAPLVREVRLGQTTSLGPSLDLLMELIRGDGSDGQQVAREAVGAGALSLCAQLLFKGTPDAQAHAACCDLVRHTVSHRKLRKPPASGVHPKEEEGDRDGLDSVLTGEEEEAGGESKSSNVCDRGAAGRMALARDLLRILRQTDFADLHNSVLEACRDVAPSRAASKALVEAGIVRHVVSVLSHNTTKSREEGTSDAAATAWVLQSQRSAAALVALLALQPELRERLVVEGALLGLASALRLHTGAPGLMAQVRVTAAAALVPLIGDDDLYIQLAVATGVLDPLLDMHASGRHQEVMVAERVMRQLARDESVAGLLSNLDVKV